MYGVNDVEFISVERLAHEQDMWSIAGGGVSPLYKPCGRGIQRQDSSKPLKHILVFKR